jgi:iron complex transport system permease protein
MPKLINIKLILILTLLIFILLFSMLINILIGPIDIEPLEVLLSLFKSSNENLTVEIVKNIRLPRTIAATITGGMLAVCGAVMQATVRNYLADPYLMGVSAGASLGATASILFIGSVSTFGVAGLAFIGALMSSGMVLGLTLNKNASVLRMLLAGIAINALCSSLTALLVYLRNDSEAIRSVIFWLMGSLASAEWSIIIWPILIVIPGTLFFLYNARNLNLIIIGDDDAFSLGINPRIYRMIFIIITALMTSSCVAFFGIIGFIGLIIPHLMRFIFGADHKVLIPFSFLAGGIILNWSDLIARTLATAEIPLGVITGIIGSPFFFWLLIRSTKN